MRETIFAAMIVALSGCALVEPEYRPLDPNDPVIAEILESQMSHEETLQALSEVVGHPVVDYGAVGDSLVAKLVPPLQEAVSKGGESFLDGIGDVASPEGLLILLLGSFLGVGGTTLKKRLSEQTKAKKK